VQFTQQDNGLWAWQIVGPRGELLADSPEDIYRDQPSAFQAYQRLAIVMRKELQTVIQPLRTQ